jgi:A/G-specific adenine glycosylase
MQRMVNALLRWYSNNARDLPWRRTRDPYAVWVAEVMLQQTQVRTVIPYWNRWMRTFPTIGALAKAPLDRVLKLWEGLGYYTRARNLHKSARMMRDRFNAEFPDRPEDILALPGVGRYTAGAICSIAFNQPLPALDGNAARVLARVHCVGGNIDSPQVRRTLWQLARKLVEAAAKLRRDMACSFVNQALMELGATLCLPREPSCAVCPLRTACRAHVEGLAERFPEAAPRPAATKCRFVAVVLNRKGRFLVRQRPANVVNAGLWEFPNEEIGNGRSNPEALVRKLVDAPANGLERLCQIQYSITRYRIRLDAFLLVLPPNASSRPGAGRWLTRHQLNQFAFPSAHRRIVDRLPGRFAKASH